MIPIKVAMTGLPKMLTEVLAAILESHDDIEVVATHDLTQPTELVHTCGADVVVIGGGPGLPESAGALFESLPQVAVLAISASGRKASRFRLIGEQIRLDDASPQQIVDTIREATNSTRFAAPESVG